MSLKHKIMQRLRAWCQACQKREIERLKAELRRLDGKLSTLELERLSTMIISRGSHEPPAAWKRWLNGEIKH